ncbi:21700_t:CDS:1 [Gigaspora margarita]|uniref:21700_t:CDS:1 n=1 Tax=Gigaspora margarita TaxID=4874 RepID=A0ABM8VV68_GIGMA|nr:21700_t:CDS:1 [Gigaspora margarita]
MRTSPESLNDPNNPSRYLREHATIFVNNPRIIENEERAELDKETREESRQVLLNHLASVCHNADYQLNPEEIMRRIDECQIEVEENIRREKREREEAEERDEI